MVCAAIRVVGALLQSIASGSKSSGLGKQEQQQLGLQDALAVENQHQQELPWLEAEQPAILQAQLANVTDKQTHSSDGKGHSVVSTALWCMLLRHLTDRAASASQPASVRVAALKELQQLLLLLSDAPAGQPHGFCGQLRASSGAGPAASVVEVGISDFSWLSGVLQSCLMSLQDTHQDVRR